MIPDVLRHRATFLTALAAVLLLGAVFALRSGADERTATTSATTTTARSASPTSPTSTTSSTAKPATTSTTAAPAAPATTAPEAAAAPVGVAPGPGPVTAPPATEPPATSPPETAPPTPAGSFDTAAAGQILGFMNGLRADQGVGPLRTDGCLTGLAQGWAQSMADSGSMTHNPGFAGCYGTAGENIGMWHPFDTVSMDDWWQASPGHLANIVNAGYGSAGVAAYADGNGECWYVVDFGP